MTYGRNWTDEELDALKRGIASGMSARAVGKLLGRGHKGIIAAARRYKLGPWPRVLSEQQMASPRNGPIPDDFVERWRQHSQEALALHYGYHRSVIGRWVERLGLVRVNTGQAISGAKPKPRKVAASDMGRAHAPAIIGEPLRNMSPAGRAADYLRRYGPVFRRDDGWMRATTRLTDAELIVRAQQKGWVL